MKKILSVSNQKGGVAKSTTCAQIGGWTAQKGKRTLLVDLDPQANLSAKFLHMSTRGDGGNTVVPPPHPDDEQTYSSRALFTDDEWLPYPTATENLWVLPASGAMFDMSQYPAKALRNVMSVMNAKELWEDFDLIIFDTPPAKNLYTEAALTAATHSIIPCAMEKSSFEGLAFALQLIDAVNAPQRQEDVAVNIGVLPTMYQANMRIHKDNLIRVNKLHRGIVTPFQIRYRPTYQEVDLVAKELPYEIRRIKRNEGAYKEWEALGNYIIEQMELR